MIRVLAGDLGMSEGHVFSAKQGILLVMGHLADQGLTHAKPL